MKNLLQSFFKTTEERINNPFIGAFMTSWILFNWKPILFLFFSSKVIEQKILYIETSFSDIWYILLYPIISAFFYVLILPYLNLLFDFLLKYSLLKKNISLIEKQKLTIQNQKELAIEEIKLEESKTEFRERNTHNKLVEELQRKNTVYEELLASEKSTSQKLIQELKVELKKREEITSTEFKNYETRYNNTLSEMNHLNQKLYEKDKEIQSLQTMINEENLRFNEENAKVVILPNGKKLIKRYEGKNTYYYNYETNERFDEEEFRKLYSA